MAMRRGLIVVVLVCLSPALYAQDTWMSVLLDGRKIGHMEIARNHEGDTLTTRQALAIRISRAGQPLALYSTTTAVEDTVAQPLAFSTETGMSKVTSGSHGSRRADGLFDVTTSVGGQVQQDTLGWPSGAQLAEGQRRTMLARGFIPGTRYTMRNFDPNSRSAIDVAMDVIGPEMVDLPGGRERLHHLRQTLHLTRGEQVMDLWVDDQAYVRRGMTPFLGFHMEMVACDRACAMAPDQDIDVLRLAMIDAPRPMTQNLRETPMRYLVKVTGSARGELIQTDEQSVTQIGTDLYALDIGVGKRGNEAPPTDDDTAANAWLQSTSPELHAAALAAVGEAGSNLQRMRRLRTFVSEHIDSHGLDVGYASALEALRSGHGDCTENAVLLTALARSLGIPARVVTGVVYATRYGGASRVFVPHAWMQAWVEGRWRSYDAALRRFDSTHIALATGNGDPWKFYTAMALLGNIRIDRATPLDGIMDTMPIADSAPAAPSGSGMR